MMSAVWDKTTTLHCIQCNKIETVKLAKPNDIPWRAPQWQIWRDIDSTGYSFDVKGRCPDCCSKLQEA